MVTKQDRPNLARLVAEVHRLATGRAVTITEAREYFKNPKCLTDVVRRSGLLHDPPQRFRLQQLLVRDEQREYAHGL